MTGPNEPEQDAVSDDRNPEETQDYIPVDDAVEGGNASVSMATYQFNRDPADAFEAFINLLLDQKIFFIRGFSSELSGDPMLDPFGLATHPAGISARTETQLGFEHGGDPDEKATMVEIESAEGQQYLENAWRQEHSIPAGDLTADQREQFEDWQDATVGGNAFMYLLEVGDPALGTITDSNYPSLLVPSYDGSVMGNMSRIEEALRAVPLDRPSFDAFTHSMSRSDPRKWRAVQSVMSMMGYYGDNIPQIRWGGHSYIDRNAFQWMMTDIVNEELKVAQHNRNNPDAPLPKPTLRGFVDRKYTEHLEESVRQANAGADGLAAFGGDVSTHIQNNIADSLNYLGQSVTPSMKNRINTMVNEMFVEGDLDAAAVLNTDLVGMQVSDDALRSADAWLAAFHGNQRGWEDNIQFGVNGTPTELLRIARGAGVDLTGVNMGKIRELGPDGEMRDVTTGEFAPISGMTTEQRHNVARWYFLTLLQQNNNNLSVTANQYANTIGNRVFEQSGFDDAWLDNTVRIANQDPTSFAYRAGWDTYEEQSQERIDALNNVEARIMASEDFSNISNKAGSKALAAALTAMTGSSSKQRRPRL